MSKRAAIINATQIPKAQVGLTKVTGAKGLYLQATQSTRKFVLRTMVKGRQLERVIGPFPQVSLRDARVQAAVLAEELKQDLPEQLNKTFAEAADAFFEEAKGRWTGEAHIGQWRLSLDRAKESFGNVNCRELTSDHVLRLIKPMAEKRPQTARMTLDRIRAVIDWADDAGWRDAREPNPALFKGRVKTVLEANAKPIRHHPALPHADVPQFITQLRDMDSMSAAAFEFLILTACRTSEAVGAHWDEIDMDARMWVIPVARMKMKRKGNAAREDHRIPLSDSAIALLKRMQKMPSPAGWVFPSAGSHLQGTALRNLLTKARVGGSLRDQYDGITVHGFRSTFRDWAAECTDYPHEVAEAALAHLVSNAVVAAYRRTTFIDKRRDLMDDWAAHCEGREVQPRDDKPDAEALIAALKNSGLSKADIIAALIED